RRPGGGSHLRQPCLKNYGDIRRDAGCVFTGAFFFATALVTTGAGAAAGFAVSTTGRTERVRTGCSCTCGAAPDGARSAITSATSITTPATAAPAINP